MSAIEQKLEMYEWLSKIRDQDSIHQLYELMLDFIRTRIQMENGLKEDVESKMTSLQEAALLRAIERSKDEGNFVSDEDAQKQFAKWLENWFGTKRCLRKLTKLPPTTWKESLWVKDALEYNLGQADNILI